MDGLDGLFDFQGIDWDDLPDDDGPDDEEFGAADYADEDADDLTPEQIAAIQAEIEAKRCLPVPFQLKPTKKIIAVVDTETDPFAKGFVVKPFCLGFDTGDIYVDFWGDDCVEQFFAYLATLTAEGYEFIIYAHNGGKFDFYFFLQYLDDLKSKLIGVVVAIIAVVFVGVS